MNGLNSISTDDMLGQAFFLAEKGWSVIPVGLDKVPLVKWGNSNQ